MTNPLKALTSFSSMTVLSRVMGLLRDICFAYQFGTKGQMDAFLIALRIPNSARRLLAEGSFSQGFIPVLADYKAEGKPLSAAQDLINYVSGALLLALSVITIIGVIAAPILIYLIAPGFIKHPDHFTLATLLLRITFPYLLFMSLAAMASAILNSYGRFAVPAFTPVLFNLSLVVATIWIAPLFSQPAVVLAGAVFVAGVMQVAVQLPALRQIKLVPLPKFNLKHQGVRRTAKLMLPTMLSAVLSQASVIVDTIIASSLAVGSISSLYYAERLMNFPLGVIGIALATVALPTLSEHHANNRQADYAKNLGWALRCTLLSMPAASIGLIMLADPILITLFEHGGEFGKGDVYLTSQSLACYAVGLTVIVFTKILSAACYARKQQILVMRAVIITLVVNVILSIALSRVIGQSGIALSTSLAAVVSAFILFRTLGSGSIAAPEGGWVQFLLKITTACLVMGIGLFFGVPKTMHWFDWSLMQRGGTLILWLIIGGAVYFAVLFASGLRFKRV